MKKSLLYLFTIICSLYFITACSDDEKPVTWQDISKTYTGNQLDLGTSLIGSVGSVKLEAVSADKVNLVLTDILPGENEVTLSAILMKGGESSSFPGDFIIKGMATTSTGELTVNGYILKGILKLDIVREMTSSVVGNWDLTIQDGKTADVFISVKGTPLDDLLNSMGPVVGQLLAQKVEKVSVLFGENGQLVVGYKMPGSDAIDLPPAEIAPVLVNLLTWYEKDGIVYIAARKDIVDIIVALIPKLSEIDITPYLSLLELNGSFYVLPIHATIEANNARLYVTKDFVQKVWPLIKTLIPADSQYAFLLPIVDSAINSAQSIEIGLGFTTPCIIPAD